MGIAQDQGPRLRARANLGQDISTISQNTASSSSSIFRRLVTRESCKEDNSCEPSAGPSNLLIPILVAIMYALNHALVFENLASPLDRDC